MKQPKFSLNETCKMAMAVTTEPPLMRGDFVRVNMVRRKQNHWQYGIAGRQKQIAYVREEVLEKA